MSELAGGLIAVGVDGSPASVAAIRWAADVAQLRDAGIAVVRAWHVALTGLAPYAPVSRRPAPDGERRRAEADLLVLGGHHADSPLRQAVGAANER
jgi:hypothetical protein